MPAAKWASAWEAIEAIKRVKMHFLQILWLENVWKLENISQFHVDNHTAFSSVSPPTRVVAMNDELSSFLESN